MGTIVQVFKQFCPSIYIVIVFSLTVFSQYNSEKSVGQFFDQASYSYNKESAGSLNFQVQGLKVHQLNLLNFVPAVPFSSEGLLIFYYTSTLPCYLTIGAERPLAGFVMIAQNLYAAAATTSLNMIAIRFNMMQLGITPGTQWPQSEFLRIYLHYSQQPLPNPGPNFYQYAAQVNPLDDDGSNEYSDSTGSEPPIIEPDPPPNFNSPVVSMTHIGCSIPNVDLDNSTYPAGSGYAGDKNACGPAAASNSLMWLSRTYPGISIPFSHRALLDSLSKYMGRQPNSGVSIKTFIQGKLNFIKNHNLPIQIKFQSQDVSSNISGAGGTYAKNQNEGNYPTWNFLKNEVADSEDVELFYKWHDGHNWRGHVVTVTGVYETEDGKKTIGIKHDINQKDTGGTVQEYPTITIDGLGRMILHRHGAKRYVSHIVSESPGPPFVTSVYPDESKQPSEFYLSQNFPNPFNPRTKIKFSVPSGADPRYRVSLRVYDVLGNEVATLVDEYKQAGSYEVDFDGSNLSSGVYFYRFEVDKFVQNKKMILLR